MIREQHGQIVADSITEAGVVLERLGAGRVLLVLDEGAARATGALALIRTALGERLAGVFVDFTPNPSADQPLRAAREALACGADAVLALGGGSCMDVAKVGALAAGEPARAEHLVRGEGLGRGAGGAGTGPLPVVAIPTTSGTGSEATHFSAIYVDGHKVSVAHPGMRPRGVILDAGLHVAMPRLVAATTGLDALCQATESLWSAGSTDASREHARTAQGLIRPNLTASVLTAARDTRAAMMLGAHLAGQAINISKTTAAHALSYELTTRFGIAHGLGVALTLGHVAAYNAGLTEADCTHPAGPAAARAGVIEACRGLGAEPEDAAKHLRGLLTGLGLPATLEAAGVDRAALEPMAEAADTVRLSNNPRRLGPAGAHAILLAAFAGA